jgi:molecular chaperone GrpE
MKKNKKNNNQPVDENKIIEELENEESHDENEIETENQNQETDTEEENRKLKDTLLRKVAEFENYKKRTSAEISSTIKYASERVIKELLPVYEDLQRSVESIKKGETKDFDTLKKGVEMIYDKFKNILDREGLKEINSLGKEFDFHLSTALLQIPKDDVEPNTVIEVVEKGYKLNDKVLKHEKVFVSSEPV